MSDPITEPDDQVNAPYGALPTGGTVRPMTRWGEPVICRTLSPWVRSCRGATTRSKGVVGMRGSWVWTTKVLPFDQRRTRMESGRVARPVPIQMSGHGGAMWLSGVSAFRGRGLRNQGRRPIRPFQPMVLTSIRAGQTSAGLALGMAHAQILRRVLLPQAVVRMLPAYGSLLTMIIKDTAIASMVAVPELMQHSETLAQRTYRGIEIYTIAMVLFFIILFPTTRIVEFIYRRVQHLGRS